MAKTIWPTIAQLTTAYQTWHKGGISLGQLKSKTGIRFSELRGFFLKAGTVAEQALLLKAKRMGSVKVPSKTPAKPAVKKAAPKKGAGVKVEAIAAPAAATDAKPDGDLPF